MHILYGNEGIYAFTWLLFIYDNIPQLGYDTTFHDGYCGCTFALQLAQLYYGSGIVCPIYSLQYSHYLCGLHMSWLMLYRLAFYIIADIVDYYSSLCMLIGKVRAYIYIVAMITAY